MTETKDLHYAAATDADLMRRAEKTVSAEEQRLLSQHDSAIVRLALLRNQDIDPSILRSLKDDQSPLVRKRAQEILDQKNFEQARRRIKNIVRS